MNFDIKTFHHLGDLALSHVSTFLLKVRTPANNEDRKARKFLIYSLISGITFIILFIDVIQFNLLSTINKPIADLVKQIYKHNFDDLINSFTLIAERTTIIIFFSLILLFLIIAKRWWLACVWFINFSMTSCSLWILKNFIEIPRPIGAIARDTFSFPSSHIALAVSIFGLYMYIAIKKQLSKIYNIAFFFFIFVLIISRLLLNVHWMIDIIGGLALGITILCFNISIIYSINIGNMLRLRLFYYGSISILFIWFYHIWAFFS